MAAEALAEAGRAIAVYDRMPSPARKFLMAGRGGLNLTHSEDFDRFIARYGAAADTLAPMLRAFPPAALRDWAHGLGEETFVGSSGRVFPRSFKASPLLRAWLARLDRLGVVSRPRHRWAGWTDTGALAFDTPGGAVTVEPKATILALGGASWPRLGADGGWTGLLAARGVPLAPLRPANSGVEIAWSPVMRERFAGEPLKRIALAFAGRTVRGEAVLTAHGLEGGAVYALSAALREALARDGTAVLAVDLKPDLPQAEIARRLALPRRGQSLASVLRKALALSPVAIGLLREASGNRPPEAPEALARLVKAAPLAVTGVRGLERAISTAGGVAFAAVDEALMLRAVPGVFVAGEMLDWEAPTGGYLLQACFATGVAAAKGALAWTTRQDVQAP
nr:TIGR03862 family flavoprotein [Labrys wisconsinensis]